MTTVYYFKNFSFNVFAFLMELKKIILLTLAVLKFTSLMFMNTPPCSEGISLRLYSITVIII